MVPLSQMTKDKWLGLAFRKSVKDFFLKVDADSFYTVMLSVITNFYFYYCYRVYLRNPMEPPDVSGVNDDGDKAADYVGDGGKSKYQTVD